MSVRFEEKGFLSGKVLVQIMGLAIAVVAVSIFYSFLITPAAEKAMSAQSFGLEESVSATGNMAIILKDAEQRICFILLIWALFLIFYRFFNLRNEQKMLNQEWLPAKESLSTEDLSTALQNIKKLWDGKSSLYGFLPYLLASGIQRYLQTYSWQETTESIKGRIDVAAEKMDSELSLIRYIAWAIPSVGFIGTVRGIGTALGRANEAVSGDITGVTSALGIAFNSTLVALFISIFLMFFVYALQAGQEKFTVLVETYCRENFLDILVKDDSPVPTETKNSPSLT